MISGLIAAVLGTTEIIAAVAVLARCRVASPVSDMTSIDMTGAGVEITARLSDTCSSCRWSVPTLNGLQARLARQAPEVSLVAEIAGESDAFVLETGLRWPVREWQLTSSERRERLPNLQIHVPDKPAQVVEAEQFTALDGLFATGDESATQEDSLVQLAPDAVALSEQLGSICVTAYTLGHINDEVDWLVTDALGELQQVTSKHRAAVAVSTFAAGQAVAGKLDVVMGLLHRELRVFGDAACAARVLGALEDAVAIHAQDYDGLLDETLPESRAEAEVLVPVEHFVVAAECLKRLAPTRRSIVSRRMWEYQRSSSEADAEHVWRVYAAVLAEAPCHC